MSHIAIYDIPAYQNDTLRFFIDFFEDGQDFDLSQYAEYKMQVKARGSNVALIEITEGAGLTPSANRMTFEVTKEQMNISSGNFLYDLEGNNSPGDRRTILRGDFNIEASITR